MYQGAPPLCTTPRVRSSATSKTRFFSRSIYPSIVSLDSRKKIESNALKHDLYTPTVDGTAAGGSCSGRRGKSSSTAFKMSASKCHARLHIHTVGLPADAGLRSGLALYRWTALVETFGMPSIDAYFTSWFANYAYLENRGCNYA